MTGYQKYTEPFKSLSKDNKTNENKKIVIIMFIFKNKNDFYSFNYKKIQIFFLYNFVFFIFQTILKKNGFVLERN